MKKCLFLSICLVIVFGSTALAKDKEPVKEDIQTQVEKLDLEIEKVNAQFATLQMEYKYLAERQKNIQAEAITLTRKLTGLKSQKKELESPTDDSKKPETGKEKK